MPPRIVIGVGIAGYPVSAAGTTWCFFQWVLGFRSAGWDVWMVEDIPGDKCVGWDGAPAAFEQSANRAHWERIVREFGLEGRATLLVDGKSEEKKSLLDFASGADLFLNISGHFKNKAVLRAPKRRIYLDLDPAFTQIWAAVYGVDMNFGGHELFFTVGGLLNRPDCRAPKLDREWFVTLPPVNLEPWSPGNIAPGDAFTTMTHWYGYPPAEYQGQWYGNKSEEFEKITDLPRQTRAQLEIATDLSPGQDEYEAFTRAGWRLVKAAPLNEPWQRYRDYLAGSKGEFCVAKNGYVRSRCGWFSDRSVCYLSLGRPVILQDTGWTEMLPAGEGLLPFQDMASAARALETVLSDEERHRRAARKIAEEYLDARKVVERMVGRI
ncbi:MAG: hypothetical protein PHD76_07870 [Methylacidiphilales bacterium]|nr:hypothetical protein [Candidatus Methylacidiphilales bacterium]